MTGDIEVPASQALDAARPDNQPSTEEEMQVTIIKAVAVSVPLAIAVFVALVALAVRNQHPDWNAWLSMGAGIGVIAGVFFGLLAGFMRSSHPQDRPESQAGSVHSVAGVGAATQVLKTSYW